MKPTKKLALGVALVATMFALPLVVQPAAAATSTASPYCSDPTVITNADHGRTVTIPANECATLSLDPEWVWDTPRSSSRAVLVYDVPTFVPDQIWGLQAGPGGTAKITSTGRPDCDGPICPLIIRLFEVDIRIVPPYGTTGGA